MNQVSDRLFKWSNQETPPTWTLRQLADSESQLPSPEASDTAAHRANATASHDELVNAGGRPAYPISLIDDVLADPEGHHSILSFWGHVKEGWRVFGIQLQRWKAFRVWQKVNRGIHEEEAETQQQLRAENHSDGGGFPQYIDTVKRRLADHGFNKPFQLDQDPEHQDNLATWIEYLGYEYWWTDKYDTKVEQLQPQFDEAWKELQEAGVLEWPFETEKDVWSRENAENDTKEHAEAQEALRIAKSEMESTMEQAREGMSGEEDPRISEDQKRMLEEALSKYTAAKKVLKLIKRRMRFVGSFTRKAHGHYYEKDRADRQRTLAQWVLEQVPLVEAELAAATADNQPEEEKGARGRKRTLQDSEDDDDEEEGPRPPKKRRANEDAQGSVSGAAGGGGGAPSPAQQPRRSARRAAPPAPPAAPPAPAADPSPAVPPPPPLRRSARLAAPPAPPQLRRSARIAAQATPAQAAGSGVGVPTPARRGRARKGVAAGKVVKVATKKKGGRGGGRGGRKG
ncbi:hypothetical protein C8A00DRAFT_15747 [Chaetomidium leptoderma]|uniref:Uncharacterized protein n=1 Tax=Chaetomidium leptoderma TaxID=669021 RepID=A0AAN6VLJ6_9PEZI|nr:hypothetical protein C8A00DRAFT_15747 [Chaetomidium leptoderma]